MSASKLKKHCSRHLEFPSSLHQKPILIADSKGFDIKNQADINIKDKVIWQCKSGLTSSLASEWIRRNLDKLKNKYTKIHIYLFIGTCDFTVKGQRYISLSSNIDQSLEKFKGNLQDIKSVCLRASVQVTFFQVPYYSVQIWNKNKGHPSPEQFKSDDLNLTSIIESSNKFIDELNGQLGSYAPKLSQDMIRYRKAKNSRGRYSINFNLLHDGVHPGTSLAKAWLFSLMRKICSDQQLS